MSSNSTLTSFDVQKLDTLLSYVRNDWPNLSEKKLAYKFPNISAEILSTINDRVNEYFSDKPAPRQFGNIEYLMQYFVEMRETGGVGFNHTRSGYICKILNSLIFHRSGIFAEYLLKGADADVLLASAHCKSVAGTLLNLITLISPTAQTPMMMAAPPSASDKQSESVGSALNADIVECTLARRVELLMTVIDECQETADYDEQAEKHSNLSWVIMQVLSRNCTEKTVFLNAVLAKLSGIVEPFAGSFENGVPNKLGNLFLVLLETLTKDLVPQNANQSELCMPDLALYMGLFLDALKRYMDRIVGEPNERKITHTFSAEIHHLNPKVYKVIEALNVALRYYIGYPEFAHEVLLKHGLETFIFRLFSDYPFNNILHNQIKKTLLLIIEKGDNELVDFYFVKNTAFSQFLEFLSDSKHVQNTPNTKIKQGYVGQVVVLICALKERKSGSFKEFMNGDLIRGNLGQVFNQFFRA